MEKLTYQIHAERRDILAKRKRAAKRDRKISENRAKRGKS